MTLTTMVAGAKKTQQKYQNRFGRTPIIWCTQSMNLSAPKIHEMAMVWKKQTQSKHIPDAE